MPAAPSFEEPGTNTKFNTVREAPKLTGVILFVAAFQTLGVVYSDIGTSPLYVLNGIWPADGPAPSQEDVIGGISAIVWSLTLVPLLKYVFICPSFSTREGEGGTFALFHGLYPPKVDSIEADRTLTGDTYFMGSSAKKMVSTRTLMQKLRWPIMIWALFGTSLTMADGILTPAISVVSAVAGIAVAKPSVSNDIVPISIAFIVALFLVQRVGTSRLAFTFAPVTFIWLALLAITGIINIVTFPGIFRAFDPSRAILLFKRTRDYDMLGGILLALTGSEAMFANLGQFNAASIQIAFGGFAYPCLVLAYLGQGSRLIKDGDAVIGNIFYLTIPGKTNGPLFWILYVFAILATIIASQTMVTACFSLVQQVINMRSLPRLRMIYTSDTIQGQIYIPTVNYILMIACVIIVVCFKDSTALTNAYGKVLFLFLDPSDLRINPNFINFSFAVATVMFTTTALISLQICLVKRKPVIMALAFFVFFGFVDGLFWGASLKKVPKGAWVPLMIGLILVILMTFWTWAKGLEDEFDGANRRNLRHFIMEDNDDSVHLALQSTATGVLSETDANGDFDQYDQSQPGELYYMARTTSHGTLDEKGDREVENVEEKRTLARIKTCAVFHKLSMGAGVPHSFIGFVRQWPALPRVVIFLSVRMLPIARVDPEDRYQVTKVRSLQGFYGVTYCLGFRDDFEVKANEVVHHICALESQLNHEDRNNVVKEIYEAAKTCTHIVPHYHVVSKPVSAGRLSKMLTWVRTLLIEDTYRPISTMFPETANWLGSADEIIRVGVNAEI